MEAFNIHFEILKPNGDKKTFVNKTFACTGFEGIARTERLLHAIYKDAIGFQFVRWEVLNPFQSHFGLKNDCK